MLVGVGLVTGIILLASVQAALPNWVTGMPLVTKVNPSSET